MKDTDDQFVALSESLAHFLNLLDQEPPETAVAQGLGAAAKCLESAAYSLARQDTSGRVARLILLAADLEKMSLGLKPRTDAFLNGEEPAEA